MVCTLLKQAAYGVAGPLFTCFIMLSAVLSPAGAIPSIFWIAISPATTCSSRMPRRLASTGARPSTCELTSHTCTLYALALHILHIRPYCLSASHQDSNISLGGCLGVKETVAQCCLV